MRFGILLEIITAIGVVFLGAVLFITLKKQNEKIALTAFGLYILEAGLSGVKALGAFSPMSISKEYALSSSTYLLTLGTMANEFFDFAMLLLLLAFFGFQVPFYLYLPYLPFEFVVGVWITITGINEEM